MSNDQCLEEKGMGIRQTREYELLCTSVKAPQM